MIKQPVNSRQDYSFVRPEHIRASRAWLGWTLNEMQEKSGLARDTISRFERGKQQIANATRGILFQTLVREGILLLPDGLRVRDAR
jgi:transcriptional regulator with XRE-family HTH domain